MSDGPNQKQTGHTFVYYNGDDRQYAIAHTRKDAHILHGHLRVSHINFCIFTTSPKWNHEAAWFQQILLQSGIADLKGQVTGYGLFLIEDYFTGNPISQLEISPP